MPPATCRLRANSSSSKATRSIQLVKVSFCFFFSFFQRRVETSQLCCHMHLEPGAYRRSSTSCTDGGTTGSGRRTIQLRHGRRSPQQATPRVKPVRFHLRLAVQEGPWRMVLHTLTLPPRCERSVTRKNENFISHPASAGWPHVPPRTAPGRKLHLALIGTEQCWPVRQVPRSASSACQKNHGNTLVGRS